MKKVKIGVKRVIIFSFILSLAGSPFSLADTGVRALSMGGAFVGLADDIEATYWNPAALGLLTRPEANYSLLVSNRDEVGFDHWFSYVYPTKLAMNKDWGVIGFSFMNDVDKGVVDYNSVFSLDSKFTNRRYFVSYGKKLFLDNLALGMNLGYSTYKSELSRDTVINGRNYLEGASTDDVCLNVDLAGYFRWEKFGFGLLLQDVNSPAVNLFSTDIDYDLKVRPGLSYSPDDKTNYSLEVFDFLDSNQIRIGGEYYIIPYLALRSGIYNLNKKENRALTVGCGINSGETFAYIDFEIDYALLYWTDNPSEEDDFSHFLGLKMKF